MRLSPNDIDKLSRYMVRSAGKQSQVTYTDYECPDHKDQTIAIQEAEDCPESGYTTWCTVGLAHTSWKASNFKRTDRMELVLSAAKPAPDLGPALATIAFFLIHHRDLVFARTGAVKGTVIGEVLRKARLGRVSRRMPHVTFVPPFCWKKGDFDSIQLSKNKVWFFQVAPITESEAKYLESKGCEAFEEVLFTKEVVLLDLERPSAV